MTKVTNTAEGPRGVILKDGSTHYLEPNESADLELHPDHDLYEGVEKGGGKKSKDETDEPKPLVKMNKTELIEAAKAENVTVEEGATNAQLVEVIEKARAAK